MKRKKILFWIITGLFAAFMLYSAVPDMLMLPDAVKLKNYLGYPGYFVPFIGVAKILGVIAILIPGYPRLKEWAYAGLFFDLVGATYSIIAKVGFQPAVLTMLLPLLFLFLSYFLHHAKMQPAGLLKMQVSN